MMKREKKFKLKLSIILTLVAILSTSCGIRDVEMKEAVDESLFAIKDKANMSLEKLISDGSELVSEKSHIEEDEDIRELIIGHQVGGIEIVPSLNKELNIKVSNNIKLKRRENLEALKDEFENEFNKRQDKFIIGNKLKEISKYSRPDKNRYMDLYIEVPDHIKTIRIENNVGLINIKDITAEIILDMDVGTAKLEDITLMGKSDLSCNVGDLEVDIREFKDIKSIDARVDVGLIDVRIESKNIEGLEYINLDTDMGSVKFYMREKFDNVYISEMFNGEKIKK